MTKKISALSRGPIPQTKSLSVLEEMAEICKRCDLYKHATQVVFGKGPRNATIMIVGEQPGNREDQEGEPFVGPAGGLLRKCLESAQIDAKKVYLTNAVKHFKYEYQEAGSGKARIHKKANREEVRACRPWLERQIDLIKPEVIIALGVTAAQSLFQKTITITKTRGEIHQLEEFHAACIVSWHPSSILRSINRDDAEVKKEQLIEDLKLASQALEQKKSA